MKEPCWQNMGMALFLDIALLDIGKVFHDCSENPLSPLREALNKRSGIGPQRGIRWKIQFVVCTPQVFDLKSRV